MVCRSAVSARIREFYELHEQVSPCRTCAVTDGRCGLGFLVNGSARASAEAADAGRPTAEDRAGDEIPAASDGEAEEVSVRFQHAVILLHAKEYGCAVTALRRVLELAPHMPEAHVKKLKVSPESGRDCLPDLSQ